MIRIKSLFDFSQEEQTQKLEIVRRIFLLSSGREDMAVEKQEVAWETWVGPYLEAGPVLFYLAQIEDEVVGYLTAHKDTHGAKASMSYLSLAPYIIFEDLYDQFPIHFHINCAAESRGKGIGQLLVDQLIKGLERQIPTGIHVVTTPDAGNEGFYKKVGMLERYCRDCDGKSVLLLGKRLNG